MSGFHLLLGNKNYSSWSQRPWLLARYFELTFEEQVVPLFNEEGSAIIKQRSPSGKVPLLTDGELQIWDSLAICEYLNERYLDGKAWPADSQQRAVARALSAEMHSSFTALRAELSLNYKRPIGPRPQDALSDACRTDVQRILTLWQQALTNSNGPWLFGEFSIADAMFAPVASRFTTYAIELPAIVRRWVDAIESLPAMQEWQQAARKEQWIIPFCEYDD